MRGHILRSWLVKARDPAHTVCGWFWTGAPAGIREHFGCLDGRFPRVDTNGGTLAPDDLVTDFDTYIHYEGVEGDAGVAKALAGFHSKGYLKCCDSIAQAINYLGTGPVLSKLGCVKKSRVNPVTGAVSVKARLIADSKQSAITKAS